jgi:hypothetical protein
MSEWQDIAGKMFPYSAKKGLIYGDGEWALITRCRKTWVVLLFKTQAEIVERWNQWKNGSCFHGCKGHPSHEWRQIVSTGSRTAQ